MGTIRVLVADDSMTVRKRLIQTLSTDPALEVIAEARDGRTATELCQRLRPDVITMDVMMPVMDGVTATEYIMANCPTPILMVSASSNRGQALQTFDALAAGAIDVLDKAAGIEPDGDVGTRIGCSGEDGFAHQADSAFVGKSALASHSRSRQSALKTISIPAHESDEAVIVAIGASIGGPSAVAKILSQIPADFPLPILLVIHIEPEFSDSLVQWIAKLSELNVRVAVDGEPMPRPGRGEILMPLPDRHLTVGQGRLRVTDTPRATCAVLRLTRCSSRSPVNAARELSAVC